MSYHFRNLVFEGGGVKGVAYVGALQALEEKGVLKNISRVGGTSAGAINAVLLGLNYTLDEVEQILKSLDFKKFMDDSWGVLRDMDRLINRFGWYKGDYFRKWIGDIIEAKVGNSEATFKDINKQKEEKGFLDMFFVGTNLSTRFAEVFSFKHTPRMCVADAIRISMSIPLFFAAKRSPRDDVYVDGGLLDNYPIKLFDRKKYIDKHSSEPPYYKGHNKKLKKAGKDISQYVFNQETLGFRLDTAKEIAVFRDQAEPPHHQVDDFFDYLYALMDTVMNAQDGQHIHSDDWQRTIYIDTLGVRTTDFDLSSKKKKDLVQSGRDGTEIYFSWYDNPESSPANRPDDT
ncbi:MAG: patatin-like phospholipase family protein [Deltaproteobacteria bacterium]|nr:patatin-like phospholipase family protein [Deltaproteobacteria bacterium]